MVRTKGKNGWQLRTGKRCKSRSGGSLKSEKSETGEGGKRFASRPEGGAGNARSALTVSITG